MFFKQSENPFILAYVLEINQWSCRNRSINASIKNADAFYYIVVLAQKPIFKGRVNELSTIFEG